MNAFRVPPGPHFVNFDIEDTKISVPERFEQQVAKYPDRVAIKTKDFQRTYEQLNTGANRIAHCIARSWTHTQPIALLLEHGAPAIMAMLGVLKTGNPFVPLDASLPLARLRHMLTDIGASVIITNGRCLPLARELLRGSLSLINIDSLDSSLRIDDLALSIHPDALSCILYTSGVTGLPKGVVHTHRNELHNAMHHTNSLSIDADDRLTLLASYSTGQGMQDIYGALLNGARLCPWSLKTDGLNGFAEWLREEAITVYHSAATVFRNFVKSLDSHDEFPALRVVRLGSEHVTSRDFELFKQFFSEKSFFVNALSSSETKTIRQYVIGKQAEINGPLPAGYPVDDVDVLILDESGRDLGRGYAGEIAVRSRYLAIGYWCQPELTNSVFRTDPMSPDLRTFRTGEWGKLLFDGCLEHLGRRDNQVKIRGYRVETYETERALLQHPAVFEAFVDCRERAKGDRYLVAYLTHRHDQPTTPTVSDVRNFLRERLPDYMIPSRFVFLAALPRAPNGKVDRKALSEPDTARPQVGAQFVMPRDPIEEFLAKLWSEILGVNELGVQDDFFDLGGNSILAMQVVARVEKVFRVNLPLAVFFQSPTVAKMRLALSRGRDFGSALELPTIQRVPRNGGLPLSVFQQRIWFLAQLEPGSALYNICRVYRFERALDEKIVEASLNCVIERHEALQTSIATVNGEPRQIIAPAARLTLKMFDCRHVPGNQHFENCRSIVNVEAQRPFDLSKAPLLRASLIKMAEGESQLLLSVHQAVCDGWSMQVLLSEFAIFYDALVSNRKVFLPPLTFHYSDYAAGQSARLSARELERQISYWKQRLDSPVPALDFLTDFPRPRTQSYRGARLHLSFSEFLSDSLNNLSARNDVTLFMTLMAAFNTLLYRYTEQEDLTVGFPFANRIWDETASVIGFFVNTLVLRTDLSGHPSFSEVLKRVRDGCLGAYAHKDVPFEQLVEALRPTRDLSRNAFFQALFTFQNKNLPDFELPGMSVERIEPEGNTSKFDLTLSLAERDGRLIGFIEFNTDLFERSTIHRLIRNFETLLEGIVADPDEPISTLPLLSSAERHQLLVEWNGTHVAYANDTCIHELFEEQVNKTPDSIALQFDKTLLTYDELNRRANKLAWRLVQLGVGPDKLVALCLDRSVDMVVGLLSILKAGGAYVPLDPAYPAKRLKYMLQDAQVHLLVTQAKFLNIFQQSGVDVSAPDFSVAQICLDADWDVIAKQSEDNLGRTTVSENMAYAIYTSGSSGTPKGVSILHRSLVNCVQALCRELEVTSDDVILALAPLAFDLACSELYPLLISGGCVVLASYEESVDGRKLLERLDECAVTMMHATPSSWKLLLDAGWKGRSNFKAVCGGEALVQELADRLLRSCANVWNFYGPTEATIWSTAYRFVNAADRISIGHPIQNVQIYILNSRMLMVPIGVPGEIYIGGDGLAQGYLNQAELMTEKFVPNPFSDDLNSRLYRTGDLAKYRADGNIEFLGRIDNQVKIRGHRIELGEIESVLNHHSSVRETVILARDRDSSGEKVLISYVASAHESAPTISELRSFLREKLPEYMIPSLFVFLDSLPLTPNGKIDRNALPVPDGERPQLDQGFVEPRTEIEELIAQVWREMLKLDRIGIYDNFFDLGGHSLLATRVVARLSGSFNVDIALRKLFELPTVAGLAQHIDHLRHSEFGTNIAPIVAADRTQPLPLSFSQRRLWFLQKVDTNLSAYNIPAAFRVKGDLDNSALEQALNEMVARHEALRSYVKEIDGQPCLEILSSLRIALPVIDLTHLQDEQAETEARRLFSADACQLYDLASAPLMRATLVKLAVDNHVFILNFHHIIADGSSLEIFYRELAALYDPARNNKTAPLARLAVQYADYAAWQHEWLKSSSFDTQLDYWKRQLAYLPKPCALPTDFDRPKGHTYHGARLALRLSGELTESLKNLSRQQSVTMFMTLFATFNIWLSRISGQEDIIIGSTIAGRNHSETDALIGFFINALPLRCDLAGEPSFATLLHCVRENCLDAYANQEMPFEKIVEALRPPREAGRNPIFDILFNIADTSERILTLAGCEVSKLAQNDPPAKFDIVLRAPEVDGKIELAIVYNTALFREGRMTLLLEQFACLLAQVVENPELPIGQLSLVTDAVGTVLPDPKEALDDSWEGAIHGLLAEQARRLPEKLAVVEHEQSWTYADLDQCANQLANSLLTSGIQPNDLIAIYAYRSSSLIVALFGILKAGASFLILDPAYPAARTIDSLRIAQPKGWLELEGAGELAAELLSCLDSLKLRCRINVPQSKEEISENLRGFAATEPVTTVTADDPAYVAFTSGSTGEPKGVVCRHGPITHFLPWHKDAFQLNEADRFAMLSGLAYSHLHRDVFTAIFLGATLYIPISAEARSPEQLAQWLESNSITVLHLTPALGQLLLTTGDARLPSVRRVFFGGDVLTPDEVSGIRQLSPNATIVSFYGATETQRAVGYFEVANELAAHNHESNKPIPLGRGIKDVQLLVLNSSQQLAGIGELGKIFVRSPHLAEGYIGDEKRTEQMFLVNPFTNNPHDRLYRTGELGRYLPDGNVEWAGRNDRRVNIRGFRVELEEIEIALKQHATVKDAAVVLRDYEILGPENSKLETRNSKPDQRLVAYISADEEPQSLADLLQSYLATRLPNYMMPAHYVILQSLPMNPNGKIDYRSLPSVQFPLSHVGSALPQTEIEVKLCAIFAAVLGRATVSIDENFFRIGGHSLLAARAAARICDAFGVSLELSTFLKTPTVMGLATKVESLLATGQSGIKSDKDQREEFDL